MADQPSKEMLFHEALDLEDNAELHLEIYKEIDGKVYGNFVAVNPFNPEESTRIIGGERITLQTKDNKIFANINFTREDLVAMRQLLNQYFRD